MTTDAEDAFVTTPNYEPPTYDDLIPQIGPWEPAMTEESIIVPKFYCLAMGDGGFHLIRRSSVLQVWLMPGIIKVEYVDVCDQDRYDAVQGHFPIRENLDVIADLWIEAGYDSFTVEHIADLMDLATKEKEE